MPGHRREKETSKEERQELLQAITQRCGKFDCLLIRKGRGNMRSPFSSRPGVSDGCRIFLAMPYAFHLRVNTGRQGEGVNFRLESGDGAVQTRPQAVTCNSFWGGPIFAVSIRV